MRKITTRTGCFQYATFRVNKTQKSTKTKQILYFKIVCYKPRMNTVYMEMMASTCSTILDKNYTHIPYCPTVSHCL